MVAGAERRRKTARPVSRGGLDPRAEDKSVAAFVLSPLKIGAEERASVMPARAIVAPIVASLIGMSAINRDAQREFIADFPCCFAVAQNRAWTRELRIRRPIGTQNPARLRYGAVSGREETRPAPRSSERIKPRRRRDARLITICCDPAALPRP